MPPYPVFYLTLGIPPGRSGDRWSHTYRTGSINRSKPWPGSPLPAHPRAPGDLALPVALSAQEDIMLLRELQVNHYRFSLSWPRLLPTGVRGKRGQPLSSPSVAPLGHVSFVGTPQSWVGRPQMWFLPAAVRTGSAGNWAAWSIYSTPLRPKCRWAEGPSGLRMLHFRRPGHGPHQALFHLTFR